MEQQIVSYDRLTVTKIVDLKINYKHCSDYAAAHCIAQGFLCVYAATQCTL